MSNIGPSLAVGFRWFRNITIWLLIYSFVGLGSQVFPLICIELDGSVEFEYSCECQPQINRTNHSIENNSESHPLMSCVPKDKCSSCICIPIHSHSNFHGLISVQNGKKETPVEYQFEYITYHHNNNDLKFNKAYSNSHAQYQVQNLSLSVVLRT